MTTYSRAERLAAIQKAGFADPLTALAVSLAEFGESRDINAQAQSDYYANGVREQSFGPWQIYLPAHPNVTQSCAMDLTCSTAKAAEISKGGTDFGAWSAFTNGSYARFVDELKSLMPPPAPTPAAGDSEPDIQCPAGYLKVGRTCIPIVPGSGPTPSAQPTPSSGGGGLGIPQRPDANGKCPPGQVVTVFGFCAVPGTNSLGQLPDASGKYPSPPPGPGLFNVTVPGFEGVGQFFQNLGTAFRPANMWRAGFLVVGAAMIVFGAKLYLRNSDAEPAAPDVAPTDAGGQRAAAPQSIRSSSVGAAA